MVVGYSGLVESERPSSLEVWLVIVSGVVGAAIGVLKAFDRAGGVFFTVLGVLAVAAALGGTFFTKSFGALPVRQRMYAGAGALFALALLVTVGLFTFESESTADSVNPRYLSQLVASGPFVAPLRSEFVVEALRPASIGDASSTSKLNATQVVLELSPAASDFDWNVWAHVEIYPSTELAAERADAKESELRLLYGEGAVSSSPEGACSYDLGLSWTCVASRGYAYAEVTFSPNSNATQAIPSDIIASLLGYTDEQSLRAS